MKALTKPKKQQAPKVSDFAKLKSLRRTIVDGHEAIEKYIKSSRDSAQNALREAILTGKALTEVKEILGYGRFERWMKEHCKNISKPTWCRYAALYNAFGEEVSHMRHLPITSLRKAYLQLGIINDPEPIEQPIPRVQVGIQSPVKQLTNGDTSGTASSDKALQDYQSASSEPAPPIMEAEIVTPQMRVNRDIDRRMSNFKASIDSLLIDLLNMLESGQYPLADLEAAALAPVQKFFKDRKP